jgi:hypothetical protein
MVVRTDKSKSVPSTVSSSSSSWSSGDHDFSLDNEPAPKAKIMLFAETGVGKTAFVCRFAPDPIAIIDMDGRALPAVKQAREELGKVIHHTEIFLPGEEDTPEETRLFAHESIRKAIRNLKWAVTQSKIGKIRTICLDTATEYDLLCKLAYDGCKSELVDGKVKETGSYGKDKDFINSQFWRIINIWRQGNAHLVLTGREKEIYKEHKATGDFTFRASKVINEAVDLSLQLRSIPKMDGDGRKSEIEVIKCGVNREKIGKVYKEREWKEHGPFALICSDVYGRDIEEWL